MLTVMLQSRFSLGTVRECRVGSPKEGWTRLVWRDRPDDGRQGKGGGEGEAGQRRKENTHPCTQIQHNKATSSQLAWKINGHDRHQQLMWSDRKAEEYSLGCHGPSQLTLFHPFFFWKHSVSIRLCISSNETPSKIQAQRWALLLF